MQMYVTAFVCNLYKYTKDPQNAYLKLVIEQWATWHEELTHWKRPWCWERLKVGGEGDDRGRDGCMASSTQWTWVLASSRRWWRTGKPGVQQSMRSRRIRHTQTTGQQQQNDGKKFTWLWRMVTSEKQNYSGLVFSLYLFCIFQMFLNK